MRDNTLFKSEIILIWIVMFTTLLSISLISSAPPFISAGTSSIGITIEHPISDTVKMKDIHEFHFHIFNTSTGLPFLNSSTNISCVFHLYNQSGNHILKVNHVSTDDIYDWKQVVNGTTNFSTPGQYAYVFQCNNSNVGGFFEHDFEVTSTGLELTTQKTDIMIVTLGVILIIGILLFIFGVYSKTTSIKIFILGLSILMIIFSIGYSISILNNVIGEYTSLINSFSKLYVLFVGVIMAGGFGLLLFLVYYVMQYWSKLRGFKD